MEKLKITYDNMKKITNLLPISSSQDFGNIESLLDKIKNEFNVKEIFFTFFHPYYYLLRHKYDLCELKNIYFDKENFNMISWFVVKNKEKTFSDLMSYLYCYIDEMCGIFIYKIDHNFFLTTQIECQNKFGNKFLDINKDEMNFVCVVSLIEDIGNKKKMIMKYNLYIIQNGQIDLCFQGSSKFQKPKNNLPMAHF